MAWYKLDEEGNIEGLLKPLAPLINYVARLNGTQSWGLTSPINLVVGDKVRITYRSSLTASTSIKVFYSRDTNFYPLVGLGNDGAYTTNAGSIKIDSNAYTPGDPAPIDGLFHTVEHTISASVSTSLLGAAWSSFVDGNKIWFFDGVLLDFEVERAGEIIHQIPLTNKSQGATQLATVGNVNATMVGYTPDVWEVDTQ